MEYNPGHEFLKMKSREWRKKDKTQGKLKRIINISKPLFEKVEKVLMLKKWSVLEMQHNWILMLICYLLSSFIYKCPCKSKLYTYKNNLISILN